MIFQFLLSLFVFSAGAQNVAPEGQSAAQSVVSCEVRFGPLELKKNQYGYFVELEGKKYSATKATHSITDKYERLDFGYMGLDRQRLNRAEGHITLVKYLMGDEEGIVPLSFDLTKARSADVFSFNTPTYYTSNTYDIVLLFDSNGHKLGGLSAPFDIGECR
ncbi:MAG: hypothetical protein M9899_09535 [Bdellovibrionaceae bacterium]|nr:hypothetical protein [Pseudobdellovibrionaceae bacterium]